MMNLQKTGITACAFLLVLCRGHAQLPDSSSYTLQQCVEIGLKNNADVKQYQFTNNNNRINWQQAKGNSYPFIAASVNHALNQGRSIDPSSNTYVNQEYTSAVYGLNAGITVWNGASIHNNIQQNELFYKASEADVQQTKDNTTINIILAYLSVLNNQEQLKMALKQVEVIKAQVGRLEILDKDGNVSPGDLYNLKGQLGSNQLTVVTTKNALRTAQLSLTQLMNIAFTEKLVLAPIDVDAQSAMYDATIEQVYEQALQNLSLVKAADLREQSAAKGVKAAKGLLYPLVSLNGNLGTNYSSGNTSRGQLLGTTDVQTDNYVLVNTNKTPVYSPQFRYAANKISYVDQWRNNFNTVFSIGVSIPILNGLQYRSRLQQAKVTEQQNKFVAQTVRIQLRQSVEQAYVNMISGFESLQRLTQQVSDYGESFRVAQVKFDAGSITSVDYNIAKNNLDQATLNLIAAKYNYILRTKILDYYQSNPLF